MDVIPILFDGIEIGTIEFPEDVAVVIRIKDRSVADTLFSGGDVAQNLSRVSMGDVRSLGSGNGIGQVDEYGRESSFMDARIARLAARKAKTHLKRV